MRDGPKQYLALKVMSIAQVVKLKQVEHIKNEKDILASISHPFIVNMSVALAGGGGCRWWWW